MPNGCKTPPYDPSLPIIVGNKFYSSPAKSAFPPELQAEMMNKSHLQIISEYFLGPTKMQELAHCYGEVFFPHLHAFLKICCYVCTGLFCNCTDLVFLFPFHHSLGFRYAS
jgi:hypothetical protein